MSICYALCIERTLTLKKKKKKTWEPQLPVRHVITKVTTDTLQFIVLTAFFGIVCSKYV